MILQKTRLNMKDNVRLKDAIILTVLKHANACFFLDTLSFPLPHRSRNEKNLFSRRKHGFPKNGWKPFSGFYVQSLSGSAVATGLSVLFRLVIRNIDWTQPQLSVNLCREAEDTVSPRRKGRWKNKAVGQRVRRCSYMPDLFSESYMHFHIYPSNPRARRSDHSPEWVIWKALGWSIPIQFTL